MKLSRRLFLGVAGVLILEPVKAMNRYRLDEYRMCLTDSTGTKHWTDRPRGRVSRNKIVWQTDPIETSVTIVRFEMFEPDYGLRIVDEVINIKVRSGTFFERFMFHTGDGPDLRTKAGRAEFCKMVPFGKGSCTPNPEYKDFTIV